MKLVDNILTSWEDKYKGFKDDILDWGSSSSDSSSIPYHNDNYRLKIYIGEKFVNPITAYLPEQVTFSSVSKWAPFLPSLLSNVPIAGDMFNNSISFVDNTISGLGYQMNTKFTKIKSWRGNEAPTFNFDLQFNAYKDPATEVLAPLIRLLSLTMPIANGALVEAPGPNLVKMLSKSAQGSLNSIASNPSIMNKLENFGLTSKLFNEASSAINNATTSTSGFQKTSNESITIRVGNYMTIRNVVLTSIHPKIDSMFIKNGMPISAEASVTFEMLYPPTRDDLENWFTGVSSNRPNASVK